MSNPEEKIHELITAINSLSNFVNSVQENMSRLTERITVLEQKLESLNFGDAEKIVKNTELLPEINKSLPYVAEIPTIRNMLLELLGLKSSMDEILLYNEKLNEISFKIDKPYTDSTILQNMMLEVSAKVDKPILEVQTIYRILEEMANKNDKVSSDLSAIWDVLNELSGKVLTNQDKSEYEEPIYPEKTKYAYKEPERETHEKPKTFKSSEILESELEIEEPVKETPYEPPKFSIENVETGSEEIDLLLKNLEKKFTQISHMITPQSSCEATAELLQNLRDEIESKVGMSPMLREVNMTIRDIEKMPKANLLPPEKLSDIMAKLEDWLVRALQIIKSKHD